MSAKKGNNATTTTTGPSPEAMQAYQALLSRSNQVASTPYQAYSGEQVAPINQQQQTGIGNINANAGFASPFITSALDYAQQGAAPLTDADISRYQNPYTQQVVDATQAQFNNSNAEQATKLKGNAIQQGALGNDRLGVAQGELARQQNMAQSPVIAGLYSNSYQQALAAAQNQQRQESQAAYSVGNLGISGQQAALSGAGAQFGVGSAMQQTQQAQDKAQFDEFMRAQAFPYQQTQWLAGIQSGVGSQMGGTSTVQPPKPNPYAQWAGLGLTAASMFLKDGGRVHRDMGGGIGGVPYTGVTGYVPEAKITSGRGAPSPASGGSQANGTKDVMSGAMELAKKLKGGIGGGDSAPMDISAPGIGGGSFSMPWSTGGFSGASSLYADGGVVDPRGIYVRGYDTGGDVFDDRFGGGDSFDSRFIDVPQAAAADASPYPVRAENTMGLGKKVSFDPEQDASADKYASMYDGVPLPPERPSGIGVSRTEEPDGGGQMPSAGVSTAFAPEGASNATDFSSRNRDGKRGFNLGFIRDDLRAPLMAAGLGMMASQSPFLGTAIGEGGLKGIAQYGTEREAARAERKTDLEAKRLDQAAARQSADLALRTKAQADTKDYHDNIIKQKQDRSGYVQNPDGSMSPVRGGPADPTQIAAVAKAKTTGGALPDETAEFLAERILAGDARALVGLGRGAQGAENIVKVQGLAAKKAAERGMSPQDILQKVAEQSGLTAQQRTIGTQVAKMAVNSTEAEGAINLGREASRAMPRGSFVPLTKIIQAGQVITSDPKLAAFGAANLAIINTYARAISPTGQPTVNDKVHAEKLLTTANSPEAYEATLDQMQKEIDIAHAAPTKAKKMLEDIRKGEGSGAPAAAPPAGTIPPVPLNAADRKPNTVYQTPKGGPMMWNGQGWVKP